MSEQTSKHVTELSKDELIKLATEYTQMRLLLEEIANNSPDEQPEVIAPSTLPQAWAFWVAGQKINALLKWMNNTKGNT